MQEWEDEPTLATKSPFMEATLLSGQAILSSALISQRSLISEWRSGRGTMKARRTTRTTMTKKTRYTQST